MSILVSVERMDNPPHPIFLKKCKIETAYSNLPVLILLFDNIILYTIPNNTTYFRMCNLHWKIYFFQLLLISFLNLPPQYMNLPFPLGIILQHIFPVLHPVTQYLEILLHLQVEVSLFHWMFLQYIYHYLLNKTEKSKYRKIHNFSINVIFFNNSINLSSQQLTLTFFRRS